MTDERFAQIKEMIESSRTDGWAAELLAALEAERAKLKQFHENHFAELIDSLEAERAIPRLGSQGLGVLGITVRENVALKTTIARVRDALYKLTAEFEEDGHDASADTIRQTTDDALEGN